MKINEFFISIPPYISVSWKEVSFLRVFEETLLVKLKCGEIIILSELLPDEVAQLFICHQKFLENDSQASSFHMARLAMGPLQGMPLPFPMDNTDLAELPIAFKIGTPDGMISAMGHNPAQVNNPTLPPELLDKISSVTKLMGLETLDQLPAGEPKCNCYFCQIMNRVHHELFLEEEVKEEDLKFRDWTITQTGDKLFSVENPLDSSEKHSVYLGHPLGCSCGTEGCEHIIAVLKS